MDKKVLVAMSGGVDSSVAAYLLKSTGYECSGAMMRLTESDEGCGSLCESATAAQIAERLGIPFEIFDCTAEFEKYVIGEFIDSYLKGSTPNPCIRCNKYLKFGLLFEKAVENESGYIATGHYARVENTGCRFLLKKAKYPDKDQSYVLYNLSSKMLGHVLFPLGDMSKEDVRKIAAENGFENSDKPDSQDICFVPNGDYAGFIEEYTGTKQKSGRFLDMQGNDIGINPGMIHYTIGQRRGLGTGFGTRVYVVKKDPLKNTVTLGKNEDLFSKRIKAGNINYITFDRLETPLKVKAKIRYRHTEEDAVIYPESENSATIEFVSGQRAACPGQSIVFYDNEYVVGGGIIL